jgi:steroid 5-alpha reductase family enzyme
MVCFLQAISDYQKSRYKMVHPGKLVTQGLYRWSRHINYFAEVVYTVVYVLMCILMCATARNILSCVLLCIDSLYCRTVC